MIDLELLDRLSAGPLLIEPGALRLALSAARLAIAEPERKAASGGAPTSKSAGSVAVIPIQGLIMTTGSFISDLMGWSNLEDIAAQVNQVAGDSRIKTVLFDVSSPGGAADGITECAEAIFSLRDSKKTVSMSRYTMASAAYWLGAAAQTVVAAPLSTTGSIGCWLLHIDQSKALEAEGITATLIKAGKYKVEANPFQALTQQALDFLQSQVDTTFNAFAGAVAKYRGTTAAQVKAGYGEGRSLMDNDAKAAGLVDSVLSVATLGARLVAGTRIALGEGLEIHAEDWCALGLGSLVGEEPLPKKAHAWEVDADYLRLLAMGAA
jgi:signal peptide peptidase SppA